MNKDRLNLNLEEIKERVTWVHNNLKKYEGWVSDNNIKYGLELMREELTEINIKIMKVQEDKDFIKEREEKLNEYSSFMFIEK